MWGQIERLYMALIMAIRSYVLTASGRPLRDSHFVGQEHIDTRTTAVMNAHRLDYIFSKSVFTNVKYSLPIQPCPIDTPKDFFLVAGLKM
jgi:hypothetical protein